MLRIVFVTLFIMAEICTGHHLKILTAQTTSSNAWKNAGRKTQKIGLTSDLLRWNLNFSTPDCRLHF